MKILKNIDIFSVVKKNKLDELNYLITLINEAYEKGLLNEIDMENIQIQMIELLDKVVYKYNGEENSSIRKELLEDISNSNIYTIGVYLKTFRVPEDAIKAIKDKGLEFAYYEGKKRIERSLNIIRVLYLKVKQNKINVENQTYDDAISGGISGFLKIYDLDFKAQDMKITADYPTYNNLIGKLEGVEFIEKYVNFICLENEFCKMFSEERIKYLLYNYSKYYKDLIINIFEIVLLEAIACKLAKKSVKDLIITSQELNYIYNIFKDKNKEETKDKIEKAYNDIKEELLKGRTDLQNYIKQNFNYIIKTIENALEQNSLDKVFIAERFIIQ